MDNHERRMNPVTITIINPRKEYWPSQGLNQQPLVLKTATLATVRWGSAFPAFSPFPTTFSEDFVLGGIKRCHCLVKIVDFMVFNAVFNRISVILWRPIHLSMLSLSSFNQYAAQFFSKPISAFLLNHSWNNGQPWERNESCCNDYHQSSERIFAKPRIEPATSCSQVPNATDWAMRLCLSGEKLTLYSINTHFNTSTIDCFWKHCGKRRNCS